MLPKNVRDRAVAMVKQLTDGGYVSWNLGINRGWPGDTRQQPVGPGHPQCHSQLLKHGSPSPPPGFAKVAAALRRANTSQELLRNRQRWSVIYSGSVATHLHHYDDKVNDEDEEDDNEDGREKSAADNDDDNNNDDDDENMRRISLPQLPNSHFMHHWSGLHGPLSP